MRGRRRRTGEGYSEEEDGLGVLRRTGERYREKYSKE